MSRIVKGASVAYLKEVVRTGKRSALACIGTLAAGVLVLGRALWGMAAGSLGVPATAMTLLAGALLVAAGVIAELDRRADRTPTGHYGTGGRERKIALVIAFAILLLIAAASYWFSTHNNFYETGTSEQLARARALERAAAEFPHGFRVISSHCERQQLDYSCSISVEAN